MKFLEISNFIKENGYMNMVCFSQNNYLKFIKVVSPYFRKEIMIFIPDTEMIYADKSHFQMNEIDNNYKNKKQRDYLKELHNKKLCCQTMNNITLKYDDEYYHYTIQNEIPLNVQQSDEELSETGNDYDEAEGEEKEGNKIIMERVFQVFDDTIDYDVEDIYLVIDLEYFMKNIQDLEKEFITPAYLFMSKNENDYLEKKIIILENTMQQKIMDMKKTFHYIHQRIYNTHLDIQDLSDKLNHLYSLQKQTNKNSSQTLFRIERLIQVIENKIDKKNSNISYWRKQSNNLCEKYLFNLSEIGNY